MGQSTKLAAHRIRVLIVASRAAVRARLSSWLSGHLDIEAVAAATAAPTEQPRARFDIVLVVLVGVPGRDEKLLNDVTLRTDTPLIVLGDSEDASLALEEAVWGHLPSDTEPQELLAAVRTVSNGQRVLSSSTRLRVAAASGLGLSPREGQVLLLVARGHTNRETALILGVSVKSVETYRARVAGKLGARSRAELVSIAMEMGLLKTGED